VTALASALAPIVAFIGEGGPDADLERRLTARFRASGELDHLREVVLAGIAAGELCHHERDGIRYSRPVKAHTESGRFSVDVVELVDRSGPAHRHPNGEIDIVLPVQGTPTFDGRPGPFVVFGAGSEHVPTIEGGAAVIVYLLPDGEIEFTRG
jgi:hypothetical protein